MAIPDDPHPRLREIRDTQHAALALNPERNRLIIRAVSRGSSLRKLEVDTGLSKSQLQRITRPPRGRKSKPREERRE